MGRPAANGPIGAGGGFFSIDTGFTSPLRDAKWDALGLGGHLARFSAYPEARFAVGFLL